MLQIKIFTTGKIRIRYYGITFVNWFTVVENEISPIELIALLLWDWLIIA